MKQAFLLYFDLRVKKTTMKNAKRVFMEEEDRDLRLVKLFFTRAVPFLSYVAEDGEIIIPVHYAGDIG